MLSSNFIANVKKAADEQMVTAVFKIRPFHNSIKVEEYKSVILERVQTSGMEFNALPGLPHFIARASALKWRDFVKLNEDFLSSEEFIVEANFDVAQAPPHGKVF